ncbi:MAG: VWA domain-containing protein [Clostridia bacterium]|nr:VWA domain-containing protein [Clostridia bacterium]
MKKLILALMIAALTLAPFAVMEGDNVTRDFVLVFDSSRSMQGTPIQSLESALKSVIHTIFRNSPRARIAVIGYEMTTKMYSDFRGADQESALINSVTGLYAKNGTIMSTALADARRTLSRSSAREKIVLFMSDGAPEHDVVRDIAEEAMLLQRIADVYSIGFFQNMSESEKRSSEMVLELISGDADKCFTVENEYELTDVFRDIAEEVTLSRDKIILRVENQADIMVTCNNETLDGYNRRTSFGTFRYSGGKQDMSILRLDAKNTYDIEIIGYQDTHVNVSVSYPDQRGFYTDNRSIKYIPVTYGSILTGEMEPGKDFWIQLDYNGDGEWEEEYVTRRNSQIHATEPMQPIVTFSKVGRRISNYNTFVYASSELEPSQYGTYEAKHAIDGDIKTVWVEGTYGAGEGEWLTMYFDPTEIIGFVIQNGMVKSPESFDRNVRVEDMIIRVDGEPEMQVTLYDSLNDQTVLFNHPVYTSSLTLELSTFYTVGALEELTTCITDVWLITE